MRTATLISLLAIAGIASAQRWDGGFAFVGPAGGQPTFNNGWVNFSFASNAVSSEIKLVVLPNPMAPTPKIFVPDTAYAVTPAGLFFNASVQLTIKYNPKALSNGVAESSLKMYRVINHRWVLVGGSVNTAGNTVSAAIPGTGTYGICGSSLSALPAEDAVLYRYNQKEDSFFHRHYNFSPGSLPQTVSWWPIRDLLVSLNGPENALYFTRTWGTQQGDVYRSNIDGSDAERLTTLNATSFRMPNTSPDGRYFVISAIVDGVHRVLRFNADGSSRVQVGEGSTALASPVFSPSGQAIAFADEGTIHIRTLNGAAIGSPIATGLLNIEFLNFNLQGTTIAFSGLTNDGWSIYSVGTNGSGLGQRSVTDAGVHPFFHPNGHRICFAKSGQNALYILDAALNNQPGSFLMSMPSGTYAWYVWR